MLPLLIPNTPLELNICLNESFSLNLFRVSVTNCFVSLFLCFSKWMLLPSYFLIYYQCLVLTTVWRLKQWWKYFLFSLTDVADKGANGSTVWCGSNSLESFTPMTCLSQKKVQVALVTLYTKVIFAWMYSLIREQKWICIFIKGLHFLSLMNWKWFFSDLYPLSK